MGIQVNVEPVLVWDQDCECMVNRKSIIARIVGNNGTVYVEEGPLYAETGQEIYEASEKLKRRMVDRLKNSSM